ncbi:hypothetical protein LGT39_14270 [Demequina sp. TTPB684]|uniref:hypothetical protein n=1 Tax=unclassified Demequina TaxID=2620311 RepID=UPI001CF43C97|nr:MULTISPECIES: hypothetical protein [unclassified Demequina]MCB2414013.1 hypothetical protein [Demequina sp. TTPB684]UPU89106.1 hypothetical protein LGT36_004060 [Demequina sp. TMPB413]
MRALRTLASALAILAGATLVVLWLLSWMTIKAIEDGAATESIVLVALKNPEVTGKIGTEMRDRAFDALANQGVDLEVWGLGDTAAESITSLVETEEFRDSVLEQMESARGQLHDALTDAEREPGPFAVAFDTSDVINDRIDQIAVVGSELPELSVAPLRIEIVSAETFEKARTGYERVEFAERYFLWAGLALIVLGMIVSTRKRFVIAKFLAAVGVFSLGAYAALAWMGPDRIASWLPGGDDGGWARVLGDVVAEEALPSLTGRLLLAAAIALTGAAVATGIGMLAGGPRR